MKKETKEKREKVKIPTSPKLLEKEGKKEWNRVYKELVEFDIIEKIDTSALLLYCRAYENWLEAELNIKEEGNIANSQKGVNYIATNAQLSSMYFKQMKVLMVEFGMTPAARVKVQIEIQTKNDLFLDYMNRKKDVQSNS